MKEYVSRTVSKMKTLFKKYSVYIISIGTSLAISILSALITMGKMSIMETLAKPPLSPPPAAFPIVWTILYILMGISAARIWQNADSRQKAQSLRIYLLQLAFNFVWSILFFNLQAYGFAFVWLIILWVLILLMILSFSKIDKPSAYLQIPYLLWVTFAAYLNFMVWMLNK